MGGGRVFYTEHRCVSAQGWEIGARAEPIRVIKG